MRIKQVKILPEFIRRYFTKKEQKQHQVESSVAEIPFSSTPVQTEGIDEKELRQSRYFLLKDQIPIGLPFSSRRPDIRVVYVADFMEAFLFFLRLCDQRWLSTSRKAGHWACIAFSSAGVRLFTFSSHFSGLDREVIGVLHVEVKELKSQLKEIRFKKKK